MICQFCENEVEQARVDFGLEVCLACANKGRGQDLRLGVMTYEHKTGGVIQIMTGRAKFIAFVNYVKQQGRGGGFNSASGSVALAHELDKCGMSKFDGATKR